MEINATVLIQLVMFLVLFAWLSKLLTEPLLRLYDERERRIEGAADEAKKLRAGADQKAGTIDEQLKKAQEQARAELAALREKGAQKEREILDEARKKAASKLEDAQADLFAATEDVKTKLRGDAEKIANEIVEKVLGRAA